MKFSMTGQEKDDLLIQVTVKFSDGYHWIFRPVI